MRRDENQLYYQLIYVNYICKFSLRKMRNRANIFHRAQLQGRSNDPRKHLRWGALQQ